jgi:hypothetical protein
VVREVNGFPQFQARLAMQGSTPVLQASLDFTVVNTTN